MNAITQKLLAGAALCALATAPAMARDAPHLNLTALHAGKLVNKTRLREPGRQQLTYTFAVTYSIPFADLYEKKVKFPDFYKFNSNSTICSSPREKFKVIPKKTEYAKIGKYTETYSYGCASGPATFYGATYKLTNPDAKGKTDHFVESQTGWFQNKGVKYKGTVNMDVSINIGD